MTVDIKRSKNDSEAFILRLERKRKKGDMPEEETCESKLVVGRDWRLFPAERNDSVTFVNVGTGIVVRLEECEWAESKLRLFLCSLHNGADRTYSTDGNKICDGVLDCTFSTLKDAVNALEEIVGIPTMFI